MALNAPADLESGWRYSPPPPEKQQEEVMLKALAARQKKAARVTAPAQIQMTATQPNFSILASALQLPSRGPAIHGPGGPLASGGGGVQRLARGIQGANNITQITNRVNRWAARRGGTLTPQSHHDESAYERDFSFAAGTSRQEKQMLRKLYRAFTLAYGTQGQRRYTANDHWDHLHFGTGSANSSQLQELIFGRKAVFR